MSVSKMNKKAMDLENEVLEQTVLWIVFLLIVLAAGYFIYLRISK